VSPSFRTALVAFDGFQSLDVTGPWEVLNAAALMDGGRAELVLATPRGAPVLSASGLTFQAGAAVERLGQVDTLIVAGGPAADKTVRDEGLIRAIARAADGARRVASVCTGAFLLAEAGLLDGRRATTHWRYCDALARRYPAVTVEPDAIYVRDGERGRIILTTAGVTAGIDLALALVEEDHGRDLVLEVARELVVPARREGGQSQFSVQLQHGMAERSAIRDLQPYIDEALAEDLSVGALAGRAHLSERQLSRLFRRELGATPAAYVERARIERARALLEGGDEPLERIASRCGFASAEVMRRAFQRRLGTSPSAYRSRFRITTTASAAATPT
jgi:transcriptional regulator GlxA family with amidase domain